MITCSPKTSRKHTSTTRYVNLHKHPLNPTYQPAISTNPLFPSAYTINTLIQPNRPQPFHPHQTKLAQSQRGHEEEKKGSGDGDGKAGMWGVTGGGYTGAKPTPPRQVSDAQKDRAEQAGQKEGTGQKSSHDHRITEAFREKMAKFCESVEALKRGETGGRQSNSR